MVILNQLNSVLYTNILITLITINTGFSRLLLWRAQPSCVLKTPETLAEEPCNASDDDCPLICVCYGVSNFPRTLGLLQTPQTLS